MWLLEIHNVISGRDFECPELALASGCIPRYQNQERVTVRVLHPLRQGCVLMTSVLNTEITKVSLPTSV